MGVGWGHGPLPTPGSQCQRVVSRQNRFPFTNEGRTGVKGSEPAWAPPWTTW